MLKVAICLLNPFLPNNFLVLLIEGTFLWCLDGTSSYIFWAFSAFDTVFIAHELIINFG